MFNRYQDINRKKDFFIIFMGLRYKFVFLLYLTLPIASKIN